MKTLDKKLSILQILLQVAAVILTTPVGMFDWILYVSPTERYDHTVSLLAAAPMFFCLITICAIITVITSTMHIKNNTRAKWYVIAPFTNVIILIVAAVLHFQEAFFSDTMKLAVNLAKLWDYFEISLGPLFYVELIVLLTSAIISVYISFRKTDTDGELEADATSVQ